MIDFSDRRTVSLAETQAAADFGRRTDRKYLVPIELLPAFVDRVPLPVMTVGDRATFDYDSVYFDTPDHLTHYAAAHRRHDRFKVRTRVYRQSQYCVFEVKHEGLRRDTLKSRIDYPSADANRLNDQALAHLNEALPGFGRAGELSATLSTHYRRATLVDVERRARVTIDVDITGQHVNGESFAFGPYAVVETKTTGRPSNADHILWSLGLRPRPLSKYCVSLAALNSALPTNRWHRTLATLRSNDSIALTA
jgi:hypothetical protein